MAYRYTAQVVRKLLSGWLIVPVREPVYRYASVAIMVYLYTAQGFAQVALRLASVPVHGPVYRYAREHQFVARLGSLDSGLREESTKPKITGFGEELGVSLISGFGGLRSIQQVVPQLRGFFAARD
uniref:Uncharacterized protein n=1 Tax=Ananas comosus var. bracteatus TaxID=296719 RepID=A0A6V7NVV4_ANACO|nr:unnamed protein product [Ananas comosus var. bracteatus]